VIDRPMLTKPIGDKPMVQVPFRVRGGNYRSLLSVKPILRIIVSVTDRVEEFLAQMKLVTNGRPLTVR
jgi:hypothetical protein